MGFLVHGRQFLDAHWSKQVVLSVRGGACIAFGATLAVVLSEGFGWFLAVHVKGAYHWQGAGAAQFMRPRFHPRVFNGLCACARRLSRFR